MANRRAQKRKFQTPDEPSEFEFAVSQDSVPSPNTQAEQQRQIQKALAEMRKKEKAEREKKIEKEKKFLKIIEKYLNRDLTKATNVIEETVAAVDAEYNAFITKYTIQEDKIYNLWTQIQTEQAKLVDLVNEAYQRKSKAVAKTASAHITALSNTNSACNESRRIINSLVPSSASDSESESDNLMTDGDN